MKYLIGTIVILFSFLVGAFVGARSILNNIDRYVTAQAPMLKTVEVTTTKYVDRYIQSPPEVYLPRHKASFAEVKQFVEEDTSNNKAYESGVWDCKDFAAMVKENANQKGLICAVVYLDYTNSINGEAKGGHSINAFDTEDRGIVFLEPQYDVFLDGVDVGANYEYLFNIAWNPKLASEKTNGDIISHITYIW